jgi:hypothetical protein
MLAEAKHEKSFHDLPEETKAGYFKRIRDLRAVIHYVTEATR